MLRFYDLIKQFVELRTRVVSITVISLAVPCVLDLSVKVRPCLVVESVFVCEREHRNPVCVTDSMAHVDDDVE